MSYIRNIINITNDEYSFRCVLFNFFDLFYFQKNAQDRFIFKLMGLRYTISKKRFKPEKLLEMNCTYEQQPLKDVVIPSVKTSRVTLDELINTNKSIVRYGDGEFNLIFGEDLPFQSYSKELALRIKEILVSNDENIMVSIPNMFESLDCYNDTERFFWRKYVVLHRNKLYDVLDMNKVYFDTEVTRPYMGVKDKSICPEFFEDFKKVWKDKDIVIVEGAGSRLGVGNDLFDAAKSIQRILCPSRDAFDKYEEILDACKTQPKNKMFILALGPTATVLAYDLAKIGYRALDIGHLDIEYEWMLRKAMVKIPVKDKYVNEVKGCRKVTIIHDEKYLNEIIIDLSDECDKKPFKDYLVEFCNSLFSFESYNETHNILKLVGFKIKFPKLEFKKKKEKNPYYYYKENNIDITTVPQAEGQIRDIQLANLALLRELDYVCKENGLKYWIDFGSVLGAIRHKGFIPWDDDIDTGMLREDYDKIIDAFKKSSRNPDIYADIAWDTKARHVLIKVMHKKTKNLFVDIFPYDFYGGVLTHEQQLDMTEEIKSIRENTRKSYSKPKNVNQIKQIVETCREKVLKKEYVEHSDLVWGVDYNHHWKNWFSSYDTVFPLKEIEFEGEKFACMNNVEKFLTEVYRDYMAYPKKIGFGHSMFLNLKPAEKKIIKELIKDKK